MAPDTEQSRQEAPESAQAAADQESPYSDQARFRILNISISINTFVASFMISQARVASTPQRFVASSGLKVNSGGKVRLNSRIIIFLQNTFVSHK